MAKQATVKKATPRKAAVQIEAVAPNLLFNFGDAVKDQINGVSGVVYSIHEYESGTIQYGIVPPFDPKSTVTAKGWQIDWQDLALVKPVKNPAPRPPRPSLGFGDEVKDKRSDFAGTITSLHEYKNGCWKYGVQPRALTKNGSRVTPELIDQNSVETLKVAEKPPASTEPPPGGPERMPV